MTSSALAAGRVTRSLMPPGGNALMIVIGRTGNASCAGAASAHRAAAAEAALPVTNSRRSNMSALHLADGLHRSFDAFGVGVPERLEVGLIHVGDDIADVRDGRPELLALDDL